VVRCLLAVHWHRPYPPPLVLTVCSSPSDCHLLMQFSTSVRHRYVMSASAYRLAVSVTSCFCSMCPLFYPSRFLIRSSKHLVYSFHFPSFAYKTSHCENYQPEETSPFHQQTTQKKRADVGMCTEMHCCFLTSILIPFLQQ